MIVREINEEWKRRKLEKLVGRKIDILGIGKHLTVSLVYKSANESGLWEAFEAVVWAAADKGLGKEWHY